MHGIKPQPRVDARSQCPCMYSAGPARRSGNSDMNICSKGCIDGHRAICRTASGGRFHQIARDFSLDMTAHRNRMFAAYKRVRCEASEPCGAACQRPPLITHRPTAACTHSSAEVQHSYQAPHAPRQHSGNAGRHSASEQTSAAASWTQTRRLCRASTSSLRAAGSRASLRSWAHTSWTPERSVPLQCLLCMVTCIPCSDLQANMAPPLRRAWRHNGVWATAAACLLR